MGLSKTEINLRRLLAAAHQQQNQLKLIHYVATLREQLEQLAAERTSEGLPRISKATVNDYSEKIEAIAANLAAPVVLIVLRPPSIVEDRSRDTVEATESAPVKLDAIVQEHITKHRRIFNPSAPPPHYWDIHKALPFEHVQSGKLQEDLTDEMVGLALMMSQSLQNTEKILDSTEKAVEHSLASTGRANVQAMAVYSESFKTSCFTWLVMFVMMCIFIIWLLCSFGSLECLHFLRNARSFLSCTSFIA